MTAEQRSTTYLERWLWCVYGMVCLMILVGGTTRLTGSGLSMVEWRPLMGTLPPMSDAEWTRVFDIYKDSPQYQTVNQWMTMADFKPIFFWEYLHRLLGRLIGLVFFVPMAVLWLRGHLVGKSRIRALIALILGGCQGLLGWYMVKSGLVDIPAVSHYRLAAHLSLAFFLGAYVLWWILDLRSTPNDAGHRRTDCYVFLGLLCLQIVYGAFMAGTRAGYMYQSFPLLNGSLIPQGAWIDVVGWINLSDNRELINVIHRWLSIALAGLGFSIVLRRLRWANLSRHLKIAAYTFLGALLLQVGLGILTAAMHIPVSLGAAHQLLAFGLLSASLWLHHAHMRHPVDVNGTPPLGSTIDATTP